MGSGNGIKNAIKKYGKECFNKEILAEANSSEELWKLEEQYVTKEIVNDSQSYNLIGGGKSYLNGLKLSDPKKFHEHQSKAGKKGGKVSMAKRNSEWHAKGGAASRKIINTRITYKLITNTNEILLLDANSFKKTCIERNWNYNTLAWSLVRGKREPIKRGPLQGFYIERLT